MNQSTRSLLFMLSTVHLVVSSYLFLIEWSVMTFILLTTSMFITFIAAYWWRV